MKKTQTTNRRIEVTVDVICDSCGNSCKKHISKDGDFNFEYMTLKATWGYGSNHDLERWEAHVCNECVDGRFKGIRFKKEEYDWITGETESEAIERRQKAGLNYDFRIKHGSRKKKK